MDGKVTCHALKNIRKALAEKNGIPFEIEECTYEGDCSGTCPKCEAELRYLERALEEKERRGEPIETELNIEIESSRIESDGGADALRRAGRRDAAIRGKMLLSDTDEEPEMLEGDVPAPPLSGQILPPPDDRLRMKRPPEDIPEMLEGEPVWPPENDGDDDNDGDEVLMGRVAPPRDELAGDVERRDNMKGCIPVPKKKRLLEKLRSIFRKK